jgi:hypothetical protein
VNLAEKTYIKNEKFAINFNTILRILLYVFIDSFSFLLTQITNKASIGLFLFFVLVYLGSLYLENKQTGGSIYKKAPFIYSTFTFLFIYSGAFFFLFLSDFTPFWIETIEDDIIIKGLLITNIALHSIWSGFHFFNKLNFKIPGFPSINQTSVVPKKKVYFLLGISIFSILVAIYTGAFGFVARDEKSLEATSSFSQYLTMGRELSYLGLIIFVYYYYHKKYRKTIYLLLIFFFFVGLSFGSKSTGVLYLIYFVITLLFLGYKFSIKYLLWGVLAVFISYSVVEPFRHYYTYKGGKEFDARSIKGLVNIFLDSQLDENQNITEGNKVINTAISFSNRMSYTIPISKAISYADKNDHSVPDEFSLKHIAFSPFYAFIPRFIWPSKPRLYFGRWFSKNIMHWDEMVSVAVTPQGYLYMAGGYFAIVWVMFLLGLILKVLYDSLYIAKTAVPLYIFMFFRFGGLDDMTWSYLSGLFKFILIYFIIYAFIIRIKTPIKATI